MPLRNSVISSTLLCIILLFAGCGLSGQERPVTGKSTLSAQYTTAIGDYLQALAKLKQPAPDTLLLNKRQNGQPDDFPDIDLPPVIRGTRIIVVPPADSGKYRHTPKAPCINLVGWVEKETAEFIFVAFWPGFQHRSDGYVNYRFNPATKAFVLQPVRLEVLVLDKEGKADHYKVYEAGRPVTH